MFLKILYFYFLVLDNLDIPGTWHWIPALSQIPVGTCIRAGLGVCGYFVVSGFHNARENLKSLCPTPLCSAALVLCPYSDWHNGVAVQTLYNT